jgi:hypothetical protein
MLLQSSINTIDGDRNTYTGDEKSTQSGVTVKMKHSDTRKEKTRALVDQIKTARTEVSSEARPHSMRRRQSMQILELESKLEQLASENRSLAEAKARAERDLLLSSATDENEAENEDLHATVQWLQNEVTRLTEVNDGLSSANIVLTAQHKERDDVRGGQHAQTIRGSQEVNAVHKSKGEVSDQHES